MRGITEGKLERNDYLGIIVAACCMYRISFITDNNYKILLVKSFTKMLNGCGFQGNVQCFQNHDKITQIL